MDFFYDKKVIPIKYLGTVAENLAVHELKKQGFKILNRSPVLCLMDCDAVRETESKTRYFEGEYIKVGKKEGYFCRSYGPNRGVSVPPCPFSDSWIELIKYAMNLPKENRKGTAYTTKIWDFTARKDDKVFLIEVKANRSRLVGNQRKILLHAKKLGFIPLLIHLEGFEMKIRYKEIRFEEL